MAGKGGELTDDETTIISGALDMTKKIAKDAMTPICETFSLDMNSKLDMHTLELIMSKGHSRVPIYSGNPTNIIGLILVKNLIFCHPENETPVRSISIRTIPRVYDNWPLYDILNQFQKGHSHMAVVVKSRRNTRETAENSEGINSALGQNELSNNSFVPTSDNELESPTLENLMEQGHLSRKLEKWEEGDGDIPSKSDEEAIGIITMEDVMEELLQEEILDETDEYVDVHNRIRINLLPSRRSSHRFQE